ncbi:hypothetical protein [Nocardia sp. NPDC051463]|uniref:hypothetical protein n=1 Tax=Nocardia sp. NPDC051463 TaxID=3154845 RepID=UPI00344DC96F
MLPLVEVRFAVRRRTPAAAASIREMADRELRSISRRDGCSNWFLDNGCRIAHRISASESVLLARCVADACVIEPLGQLAAVNDMICSAYRAAGDAAEPETLRDRVVRTAFGARFRKEDLDDVESFLMIGAPNQLAAQLIERISRSMK